jgi:hypothetical protein
MAVVKFQQQSISPELNHQKYLPERIAMIVPVIIELLAKYIKTIIAIIMQMS